VETIPSFCPVNKKHGRNEKCSNEPYLKRWTHFDHGVDVAFRSSEFGGIFDPYEDDKIKIMPHVVLVEDVILEADGLIVELGAIEAAGETRVLQNLLLLLLLAPQIGERVDNDTENEIKDDNDDHEEEEHVVNHSSSKHRLLEIPSTNKETVKGGY
jgi:hypothetical protein